MLRCLQIGLKPSDLPFFDYGEVMDLFVEAENDNAEYNYLATQEDFDRF